MFGVFDGHGGGEVARYTKRHFEDGLKEIEEFKKQDYKEGLRKGFLDVDDKLNAGGLQEVAKDKRENPPNKSPLLKVLTDSAKTDESGQMTDEALALDSIGCTANVVMFDNEKKKLFVANSGDSRAVMGQGGKAIPLSFDHKPENEEEIRRIEAAGSTITDGRVDGNLNLTRALGDLKYKQKENLKAEEHPITANPDTYEYDITADSDFVFMGCDGCWETKSNDEMVEWIYKRLGSNAQQADLKTIVSELLNEIVSPDHVQTSKYQPLITNYFLQMASGVTI